jgi:hypothetical protein
MTGALTLSNGTEPCVTAPINLCYPTVIFTTQPFSQQNQEYRYLPAHDPVFLAFSRYMLTDTCRAFPAGRHDGTLSSSLGMREEGVMNIEQPTPEKIRDQQTLGGGGLRQTLTTGSGASAGRAAL